MEEPSFRSSTFGLRGQSCTRCPLLLWSGGAYTTPKWEQRVSTQPSQAGKPLGGGVLVCSGSHNKLSRMERLKQQKYIFSVWEAGAPGSRCGPLGLGSGESTLVGSQVPAFRPLPHMAACLWGQRESLGVSSSSFRDTSSIISGPHPYKLI